MVYNEILRYFPKRIENTISEYIKLNNTVIEEIIKINQTNNNKIIVKYKDKETADITEVRNIKNKIDITKLYDLSFDYDSEGHITTAIITELQF